MPQSLASNVRVRSGCRIGTTGAERASLSIAWARFFRFTPASAVASASNAFCCMFSPPREAQANCKAADGCKWIHHSNRVASQLAAPSRLVGGLGHA